jgi:predicted lipoprotein
VHATPLAHTRDTTDFTVFNAVNSQFPYLHHNVTFNHVMCAKVQDKIKNNVYDIAIK